MPDSDKEDSSNRLGLDELIPISEAAKISGLSQSHLALLSRTGKIWAKKFGRDWWTTKAAVLEYIAREHRPGPKPQK